MYARSLEFFLQRLSRTSDFGQEPLDAYERRFRSLRGCALLPRGRENRAQHLTEKQVVHAIFGIVATQSEQAGFTSIILSRLVPASNLLEPFRNLRNLADVVTLLLEYEPARNQLKKLSLSMAEAGVNSHGYAEFLYTDSKGELHQANFVNGSAGMATTANKETKIHPVARYAPISREIVLNKQFFKKLVREIDRSRHLKKPPGDGEEYSIEEAEERRRRKLGVFPGAHYLNIGVDCHVTWPEEEQLVKFGDYELVLMPRTKGKTTSVHIDIARYGLTPEEAMTVINRFLSLMSWVDDQYAIAQNGWSGNPIPVAVSKHELAFVTARPWLFDRRIPEAFEACRALALYREARNAQQNFIVSYAVLNFYKIIEIKLKKPDPIKKWMKGNFEIIQSTYPCDNVFKELDMVCGEETREDYLYNSCRIAVAHASHKSPSDPDDAQEIRRLHVAAESLRWIARHFIKEEMSIGDQWWEDSEN